MDLSSDEADIDDWFIESFKIYKDLHVFQLEHPTKVIEWTGEKSICVAGYNSTKNEVLELLLPLKLFAGDNQGLCAERDFKVDNGGFSEEPVECLKHVSGTRCVVTSSVLSSKLQLWDIGGDDNDVIKRTGFINSKDTSTRGSKIAPGLMGDPSILHGSRINDIQLTELATGKALYSLGKESIDSVSCLQFVSASVFLVCACNGDLYLCDTRDPSINQYIQNEGKSGSHWCMDIKKDRSPSDPASCTVARLSSSCQVVVHDLRDLRSSVSQAHLNVQHQAPSNDFMNVTWAPALDGYLAVSGFDGMVRIYDTTAWRPELQEFQPTFLHRGHIMSCETRTDDASTLVTTHVWHPWRPRTVLSATTDGSIHVWDWVDKEAGSC